MKGGPSQSARVLAATDAELRAAPSTSAAVGHTRPAGTSPLAFIALEEFTQRRDALRGAVRQQGYDSDRANRIAQLWLAIAFAAGARPAEADGFMSADDIAPRVEWLAELARARDAQVKKSLANPVDREPALKQHSDRAELRLRGFGLSSLALHLGAPAPSLPIESTARSTGSQARPGARSDASAASNERGKPSERTRAPAPEAQRKELA